jgi:hypothetical protein
MKYFRLMLLKVCIIAYIKTNSADGLIPKSIILVFFEKTRFLLKNRSGINKNGKVYWW